MNKKNFFFVICLFVCLIFSPNSLLTAKEQNNDYSVWNLSDYVEDKELQKGILNALKRKGIVISNVSEITQDMLKRLSSTYDYIEVSSDIKSTKGFSDVIESRRVALLIKGYDSLKSIDLSGLNRSYNSFWGNTKNPVYTISSQEDKSMDFSNDTIKQYFEGSNQGIKIGAYSGFKNIGGHVIYDGTGWYPYTRGKELKEDIMDPLKYNLSLNEDNYKEFEIPLNDLYIESPRFTIASEKEYNDAIDQINHSNTELKSMPAWFDYGAMKDEEGKYFLTPTKELVIEVNNIALKYQMSFDWNKKMLRFTLVNDEYKYEQLQNKTSQSNVVYLSHFAEIAQQLYRDINPMYGVYYNVELLYTFNVNFAKESQKSGSVTLQKKDNKTMNSLKGAVFSLKDSNNRIISNKLTTDSSGKIQVKNLLYGKYTFSELKPPKGYVLENNTINFTISKDNENISLVVYNKKAENLKPFKDSQDKKGLPKVGNDSETVVLISLVMLVSTLITYRIKME